MINFRRLRSGEENEEENNINDINNINNVCFISCCVFILYFLLTVPSIFIDIILGFIYNTYRYNCSTRVISILSIDKWLITNGILCYLNLIILILLKIVYTDNTFFRKLLKYSGYIITIFILSWTMLGFIIFFRYYYGYYGYYGNEKCPMFFYNYLFIRIVLSPLIIILRFVELYNV